MWRPVEDVQPKEGDVALIMAESVLERRWGVVLGPYPQLCIFTDGDWYQLLRGGEYGLGCDGRPKLIMMIELPG